MPAALLATMRVAVFALVLLSLVAGRSRNACAEELGDVDGLGIRARVALPVAVLSVDGAPDVPAGGLCLALAVRGFSRFTSRERGLVFEDGLDLSITGSPFRRVSTGGGFTWRYGLELGVRGASTGVLLGTSVDTMGWAFSGNGGTGFTSAAVPTSLRVELRIAHDARASATAFATVLPLGARRYGGELRIDLYATAKDHYGGAGRGLAALGFYAQGSDTGGQAYLAGGARKHGSLALAEIGVIETFR